MVEVKAATPPPQDFTASTKMYVLFFFVGLGGWLNITGSAVMQPIIVKIAPEGYGISSYTVILIQFANMLAVVYGFVQSRKPVNQIITIPIILICTTALSFLFSMFWNKQSLVFGQLHSTGLFTLIFFSGVCGSFAIIDFYAFTSPYGSKLVSALATGMGTAGLIASMLSLVQNPTDPRFSIEWYFRILGILCMMSVVSFFIILKILPTHKKLSASLIEEEDEEDGAGAEKTPLMDKISINSNVVDEKNTQQSPAKTGRPWAYAFCQFYLCSISFFVLGSAPYAVRGYSNSSVLLMFLPIGGLTSSTIGRFLTTLTQKKEIGSLKLFWAINFIMTVLGAYLATMVFDGQRFPHLGGWLIVIVYAVYNFFFGFLDTLIFITVAREYHSHTAINNVKRATRMIGLALQFGSVVGSTTSFMLLVGV
eukprot:TRINITY_DN212_c0_g1_i1.p1 TRINITY_DN212_c0_g1~~TRINITY_DN212_c0_g1_i1.p1  ORF type:complete len:423 (-),score=62.92 TRINITY_DN212_c0_g1_i1:182-1450(-)